MIDTENLTRKFGNLTVVDRLEQATYGRQTNSEDLCS